MPRVAFLALLTLALPLCTTLASVPRDDDAVESLDLLGTWQATSLVWKGKHVTDPTDAHFVFSAGNRYLIRWRDQNGPIAEGHYRLHLHQHSHGFDFLDGGLDGEPSARGIFRLRGNRLTLYWTRSGRRPKSFVPKPDSGTFLVELVRVK